MAVKLHTDCAATKLVSTNAGQCQFFTHVMEKLDEQQFGVFVIGKKLEKLVDISPKRNSSLVSFCPKALQFMTK